MASLRALAGLAWLTLIFWRCGDGVSVVKKIEKTIGEDGVWRFARSLAY